MTTGTLAETGTGKAQSGEYVNLTVLRTSGEANSLIIELTELGEQEIAYIARNTVGISQLDKLEELLADHLEYGGWSFVAPEAVNAHRDAPILTHNNGNGRVRAGRATKLTGFFWFPDYEVTDPIGELLRVGRVVFIAAE